MMRLSGVCVLLAWLTACSQVVRMPDAVPTLSAPAPGAGDPVSVGDAADTLALALAIPATAVRGTPVHLHLLVHNPTRTTILFDMGGRREQPSYNFVITDANGRPLWRRIDSEDLVLTQWSIMPGGTLSFTATWDQRTSAGRLVESGEYWVRGMLGLDCLDTRSRCPVSAPARLVIH
jgi:hypothetical protein